MSCVKGTRYMTIRKLVRERGAEFEKEFLARITPDEKEKYEHVTPVSWITVEDIPECHNVVTVAAEMFFLGETDGVEKVAAVIAQENLDGIYKFLLQIPSVEYAVKRSAKIWRAYNDTGEAEAIDVSSKSLTFVVRKYPHMTVLHRRYVLGFLKGMMAMTRAKKIIVQQDEADPENWKWYIQWE